MTSGPDWVVGVDGGGSHTRAVLQNRDGTVGRRADAGPSNVLSVGLAVAEDSVRTVLQALRCPPDTPVVLAMAGAGREWVRQFWEGRLAAWGLGPGWVVADYLAAWAALTEGGPGLVAVVGTGSVVYGERPDRPPRRVGGYGVRLGDPGSGWQLATRALAAALAAREGWGDATALEAWVDDCGGTPEAVLAWVYGDDTTPGDVAAWAGDVLRAAAGGDPVAGRLVREEMGRLARQMLVGAGPAWDPAWPVGLAGGLAAAVRPWITEALAGSNLPAPVVVERPPVEGAAWLARRFAEVGATREGGR